MKPLTVFIVALAFGTLCVALSHAADPVDVFVPPVPATPPGTSAAILPPGTYHAVTSDGIRLSGLVHSPGSAARFPMPMRAPSAKHGTKLPKRDPQLRFVPVQPPLPVRP
jgi:hypothetical protein